MFPLNITKNNYKQIIIVKASFLDVVNTNPALLRKFIHCPKKNEEKKVLNSLVPKNLGLQESRLSAQPDMFYQSLEVHVARYREVLHVSDPPRGSIDVHQRLLEDVHQEKARKCPGSWGYANLRKIKAIRPS